MKKKIVILLIAIVVLGLSAGAYAIKLNRDAQATNTAHCNMDCCKKHDGTTAATADAKDSCCGMENCCKDGHCSMGGDCCKDCCGSDGNCPMKHKQTASAETTDMKNVVVAGGGEDCCKPGADCCKGGSCCKKG
jgi:hypothetical protein